MAKRGMSWLIAVTFMLAGCRIPSSARIGLGVITAAVYISLSQEAEDAEDHYGDSNVGSILTGATANLFLIAGTMYAGSGVLGVYAETVGERTRRRFIADNQLAIRIREAALLGRCEEAQLKMEQLTKENDRLAEMLRASDRGLDRCLDPQLNQSHQ